MKNTITVSLTTFGKFDISPINILKDAGLEVKCNPFGRKITSKEIIELASGSVGLIAGTEDLDGRTLEALPDLKVISRCGAGLDNVDLNTASRLGITVFNTPDAPTLAVAELTIGLLFNLLRKVSQMDREIRKGLWQKRMGNLLHEKKVGIIGFGRIGRKVAELLKLLCCEISYCDPFVDNGISGFRQLTLNELLCWADIVSIHVSSKDGILGAGELGVMKPGAWLINVSRGKVVDETSLYNTLSSGYLSGAALDVFEHEPYTGILKDLDNVILTPHIGSYAKEARIKMEMEASENLLKGLKLS